MATSALLSPAPPLAREASSLASGGNSSLDDPVSNLEVGRMGRLLSEQDEARYLRGLQAGDTQLFDALCLATHDALWRFAFSLLHSREEAQDVVQDILYSLWERRERLTITVSLSAYLLIAVRRRALMYLRNDRTATRIAASWLPEDVPAMGKTVAPPQYILEHREMWAQLQSALQALSPVRRHVLMLRWGHHLEYTEIADIMEMSVEAVRAHVSRAYRELRKILIDLGAEPPQQ